jgi:hypothetical protein
MLVSTITEFVRYIPTAEGTDFSAIKPFLEQAESELVNNLLGSDLMDAIAALELVHKTKEEAKILVAYMAYRDAIPFADIVQTPTGFAVVNNANQAPASKERVERLIKWTEQIIDRHTDILINHIYTTGSLLTEWKKFSGFGDLTNCFFFTGSDYAFHVSVKNNKRERFMQDKGKLIAWQENVLAPVISKVFLEQLISEVQNNNLTNGSFNIIHYCKMILARMIEDKQDEAVKLLNAVANILDSNLDTYPAYAQSDEYKLKSGVKYENTAEAPGFFFGM